MSPFLSPTNWIDPTGLFAAPATYSIDVGFSPNITVTVNNSGASYLWDWAPTKVNKIVGGVTTQVPLTAVSVIQDIKGRDWEYNSGKTKYDDRNWNYTEIIGFFPGVRDYQGISVSAPFTTKDYGSLHQEGTIYVNEQALTNNPAATAMAPTRVDNTGVMTHLSQTWGGVLAGGWVTLAGFPKTTNKYVPAANVPGIPATPLDNFAYSKNGYTKVASHSTTLTFSCDAGAITSNLDWTFTLYVGGKAGQTYSHKATFKGGSGTQKLP